MAAMMLVGFASWQAYRALERRRGTLPPPIDEA
jgi:hypothetical protein